jgi:hypothetical protein
MFTDILLGMIVSILKGLALIVVVAGLLGLICYSLAFHLVATMVGVTLFVAWMVGEMLCE